MSEPSTLLSDVNGLLWPGFLGRDIPPWLAQALTEGLYGVVLFGNNLSPSQDPSTLNHISSAGQGSPVEQSRKITDHIHQINPFAVIGIDEEGGDVTRLQQEGSDFPPAAMLGRLDSLELTQGVHQRIGELCQAAGVDIAIAPVADVNTNPANPVIGTRAFGSDPVLVSRHVAAAIAGLHDAGIGSCAKHFPGHGDTRSDSHLGLPQVELPVTEYLREHLPPFQAAIAAGTEMIMSAHIVVPAWGPLPATINPQAITMLRELGYDGVLVTDALDMAAISGTLGSAEGAVQAILAGADLLCIGSPGNRDQPGGDAQDYLEIRDALMAAVSSGRIPEVRIQEALRRNRALAQKMAHRRASAALDSGRPSGDRTEETATLQRLTADAFELNLPASFQRDLSLQEPQSVAPQEAEVTIQLPLRVLESKKLTVYDARPHTNLAVASSHDPLLHLLRQHFQLAVLTPADNLKNSTPELVLVDALYPESPQLQQLVELRHRVASGQHTNGSHPADTSEMICVNTGVSPADTALPVPVLTIFGAAKLNAEAAVEHLIGTTKI